METIKPGESWIVKMPNIKAYIYLPGMCAYVLGAINIGREILEIYSAQT